MKYKLSVLICCILVLACYLMLHHLPLHDVKTESDRSEESSQKKEWIHSMLQDPSTGLIPEGIRFKELQFLHALQQDNNVSYKNMRGVTWNMRGPWNVGGRTRAIAVDVKNENHIIAGAVSGGIWQSWDAGTTWAKVSDSNAHPGVMSIAQDTRPGKTAIWYALSGEIYGTSASGGGSNAFYLGDGAFLSLDNGNTWKPIKSTAGGNPNVFSSSFQGGWRIVTSPVDTVATCVYMATYGSIFRSIDTGNTWTAVLGNNNSSYFTDVKVSSKGIVYAALSSGGSNTKGFYRSGDGVHFTNITPAFLKSYDRTVLDINPNNENEVYFLSELPSDTSGGVATANFEGSPEYVSLLKYTYISGDGSGVGGYWTNLSANLPVNSPNQFDKFNCQGGYDLMVSVQPGTNNIFVGGTNLYRSTDGFTSDNNTKQIGGYGLATQLANFTMYPNHHPDQHELIFLKSSSSKAYSISDGGVKFSNNVNAETVEWQEKSLGYVTSQVYTVNIDESKPYDQWILSGFQDNANYITRSNNKTTGWQLTVNGDGSFNYIAPDRAYYIISTQQGNVRKVILDEKGQVIRRMRIDPDGVEKSVYSFINPLLVDPKDAKTLYMPIGKTIARFDNIHTLDVVSSTSKLKTGWKFFSDTITTIPFDNVTAKISAIAMSKTQPNILYLGTSNKEIYKVFNPQSTSPTFKKCSITRLPPNGSYVSDIAVDPDSTGNLLVCYSNYSINSVFFSRDTGNTWYMVGGNIESNQNSSGSDPSIRSVEILVDKNGKRHYFAGTSIGLFSTDSLVLGTSNLSNKTIWKQESPDQIGAAVVTDIKTRNADGYIVVGTHGNGIFDSYYFGNNKPQAANFGNTLEIYPNPAINELNYTFTNDVAGEVHADIVDMNGRKVMTAINAYFNAGTFTVRLNVTSLASGHYFFSLYNQDKKPKVKHFVILKS
ncbi:MAG: T9SS type A sorting domain-containing protein [Bacteroidetes bacterium]|nr:T9SS type A sorting domain-containing protein [Bacteroidota bacterium]